MGRAKRVCKRSGCPNITDHGYCADCERQADAFRGRRQARGYDAAHDRLRRHWVPLVAQGAVQCARCSRPILPGEPWALDHTDDRSGYLGPSHERCNNAAGGRASHTQRDVHASLPG
jgi:hypothetical protein